MSNISKKVEKSLGLDKEPEILKEGEKQEYPHDISDKVNEAVKKGKEAKAKEESKKKVVVNKGTGGKVFLTNVSIDGKVFIKGDKVPNLPTDTLKDFAKRDLI